MGTSGCNHLFSSATSFPKYQVSQSNHHIWDPSSATTSSPQRPVFQNTKLKFPSQITIFGIPCQRPPLLLNDHLFSSATTSSPQRPPLLLSDHLFSSATTSSPQRPPLLLSDHLFSSATTSSPQRPPLLLSDQFSKIPKVSKSNHYIWNLSLVSDHLS